MKNTFFTTNIQTVPQNLVLWCKNKYGTQNYMLRAGIKSILAHHTKEQCRCNQSFWACLEEVHIHTQELHVSSFSYCDVLAADSYSTTVVSTNFSCYLIFRCTLHHHDTIFPNPELVMFCCKTLILSPSSNRAVRFNLWKSSLIKSQICN